MLFAQQSQQLDVAGPALAEAEIVASHHGGCAHAGGEDLGDELLCFHRGKVGVELEHQHRVGAGVCEQILALIECGQSERRQIRLEEAHRVRVESRDDDRAPLVMAARDRPPDDRLVAEVKTVEIAEREDAPAKLVRECRCRGSRAASPACIGGAAPVAMEQGWQCRISRGIRLTGRRAQPSFASNNAVTANFGNFGASALDSDGANSYLQPIPIHRSSGGAFVRASVFRLQSGFLARRWAASGGPWS